MGDVTPKLGTAARQTAKQCVSRAKDAGKTIRAEICQADVGSNTDRKKLMDFTRCEFHRLDMLINNAGVAPEVRADILEAGEESFGAVAAEELGDEFGRGESEEAETCEQERMASEDV